VKTGSDAAALHPLTLARPNADCKNCTGVSDKLDRFAVTMRAQAAVLTALLGKIDGMTRDEIIEQVDAAVRSTEALAFALLFTA
jgi:hypothetical protein